MTYIIGFAGPAGVGKDTTCDGLVRAVNNRYRSAIKLSFADRLYDIVSFCTNIPKETLRSQEYKNVEWTRENAPLPCLIGWTPRKFLQKLGTEGFRHSISNDYWVEATIKAARLSLMEFVFISDARFPNEFDSVDVLVELSRDGVEYAKDHESAFPPDQSKVALFVKLDQDIDYDKMLDNIIGKIV